MSATELVPAKRFYWFALAVLLLMLLGTAFRLVSLPHESFGGDELFTRRAVLLPLPQSYVMVRDDMTHPPLHYLLLKFITPVRGTGEFGFRALSLFCGIATIGLIAMLGSRLPRARWCGLLAASIMAVSRLDRQS